MANIHLNRDRRSLGQFSPEEVAAGLQTGQFLPTDLAWREGMETWKPLAEFSDLPVVEIEAPPPVLAPGMDLPPPLIAEVQPAWERRPEVRFFPAVFQTIRDVLGQPALVFASLKSPARIGAALGFYLFVGTLTTLVAILYQLGVNFVNPAAMGKEFAELGQAKLAVLLGMAFAVMVFLVPIVLAVISFLTAGVLHLCLLLIGGARKPFATTFQVSAYANGAAMVFQLVPACGGILAWGYGLVVTVIGLKQAHEIETPKAVIAVLLPLVLCCGALVGFILLAEGMGWIEALEQFARQAKSR